MEGLDDESDDTLSSGTLCGTGGVIITIVISRARGGFEDEEFEEFRGEAIRGGDSTKGEASYGSLNSCVVHEGLKGREGASVGVRKDFAILGEGIKQALGGSLIWGELLVEEATGDRAIEAISRYVQFRLEGEGAGGEARGGGGDSQGGDKAISTLKAAKASKELTPARLTKNVGFVVAV